MADAILEIIDSTYIPSKGVLLRKAVENIAKDDFMSSTASFIPSLT